jgi:hypothetical protein
LRRGGVLIATIVDDAELAMRLPTRGAPPLYTIDLCDGEGGPPLGMGLPLGSRYHFRLEGLVDCDEYAVEYVVLCELAKAAGFSSDRGDRFVTVQESYRRSRRYVALTAEEENLVGLYRFVMFTRC